MPSPLRAAVTGITVCAVTLIAPPAGRAESPAPQPLRLDYQLYAGGLQALGLTSAVTLAPDRYDIRINVRTTGWIGRLFPFVMESTARGARGGPALEPERYSTVNRWDDSELRWVRITYGPDGPSEVEAVPAPQEDDRPTVPPAARQRTTDPLSGIFTLILGDGDERCRGTVQVFDGRRRYDITAEPIGSRQIEPSSYTAYSGEAQGCRLSFETITGFWTKHQEKQRYPEAVKVWTATLAAGLPPVPVRVEADGTWVPLRVHLTAVARGAEAVALPDTGLAIPEDTATGRTQPAEDGRKLGEG